MQPPPLPPVYVALLDASGLDALFADLALVPGEVHVSVKHGPGRDGERAPSVKLAEVHEALARGEVHAVQLRYAHDAKRWCDTLMVTPGGTRIVRMELLG